MRLAVAVLADAVNVREGMLNVLSAGATVMLRTEFPTRLGVQLAMMVELNQDDLRSSGEGGLLALVIDPAGEQIAKFEGQFGWEPGDAVSAYLPTPINMSEVEIETPGVHEIRISLADQPQVTLYANIVDASNDS